MAKHAFISSAAVVDGSGASVLPSALTAGSIGLFLLSPAGAYTNVDLDGVFANVDKASQLILAQKTTSGYIRSVTIPANSIQVPASYVAGVATIPYITTFGWSGNGTNSGGVITAVDTNTIAFGTAGNYGVAVYNTSKGLAPFESVISTKNYATDGLASKPSIANDLVKLHNNTMLSRDTNNQFAYAYMLSSGTRTTAGGDTCSVTTGSTTVTTLAISGLTAVVGDYLSIGQVFGTSSFTPMYKITAIVGDVVTIDSPYVNANMTSGVAVALVPYSFVTAAAMTAAGYIGVSFVTYGNSFAGSARLKEATPNRSISINATEEAFTLGCVVQNNGSVTKASYTSAGAVSLGIATEGKGISYQVLRAELEASGYWGATNKIWIPDSFEMMTVGASAYNGVGFSFVSVGDNALQEVQIFSTATTKLSELATKLNSW